MSYYAPKLSKEYKSLYGSKDSMLLVNGASQGDIINGYLLLNCFCDLSWVNLYGFKVREHKWVIRTKILGDE